ncbi:uncharacterized protein LOC133036653 [Cannabis sativa]|uniref:uncharacterized protein LOC133036653 n=1 Tax=Cannabis sativa TaxID=3483 RepID=UPI0029CA577B|nr:uncharacterized protein LOC133036653 [Cannabis sativa]
MAANSSSRGITSLGKRFVDQIWTRDPSRLSAPILSFCHCCVPLLYIGCDQPWFLLSEDVVDFRFDHLAEDEIEGRYLIFVELQYFIELGALFEDVIALLSKFPGAVLSHGARSKILAAHGWQSMLCG